MITNNSQIGYSLVEVLVSISILLVVIAGPMTIASRSIQYAEDSRTQTTAFFLAQEGIEYMTAIRNYWAINEMQGLTTEGWRWEISDSYPIDACIRSDATENYKWCGLDTERLALTSDIRDCGSNINNCRLYLGSDGVYSHNASGEATQFIRTINIARRADHFYRVTSRVQWNARDGRTKELLLESYLYDIYR